MKVVDLARLVLDQAPHHTVEAALELPEGYRLLPAEPSDFMVERCSMLGHSPELLRLFWATMVRAHDAENEE